MAMILSPKLRDPELNALDGSFTFYAQLNNL